MLHGRLNRRLFLASTAAVSVTALARRGFADAPRRGGTLRQGLMGGSSSDTLDPLTLATQLVINVNYQLANNLIEIDADSKPVPELAESFESTPDAKRWIFKLRRGVTFHNGKTMTAADVVYSLNRHRGPDTKSAAAAEMKIVTDVRATGETEVTIDLDTPYVDLPYLLGDVHLTIMPEGDTGLTGMGTGAYILETFEPGVRYLARRNPDYFKSDRGWFDAVETLVINDGAARITALQAGEVDMINSVEPRAVAAIDQNPDLEVVTTKGRNFLYFPMHCDKPPLDNADLRLAVKYAVDREEMVKTTLLGFGSVGNDHPIMSAYPFFADDIPQRLQDIDKAKFHYKRSGHSGPIEIKISDAAFPGAVDAAILLQRSMAAAGMELAVTRVPNDGYWEGVWNVAPFCGSQWSGRATQDLILSSAFLSNAPWNDSKWNRAEFDQLILAARSEFDEKNRTEIYSAALKMVHDDAGHLTPMFNDYIDAISKKVKGFVRDPNFELSGYRAAERCWFAEGA
jgi:peptide/nickel transport system substrate-binding protein